MFVQVQEVVFVTYQQFDSFIVNGALLAFYYLLGKNSSCHPIIGQVYRYILIRLNKCFKAFSTFGRSDKLLKAT